ncbi:hydroxyacid dehydrogenase [Anaerocolumna sedimenticola]|uniref:Hydroxyacid dehydrogenase n=1 Tax=Anaerocolumna sedimenticola TaxID=2696063 RepID=A0A6P1TK60_9FIRM|nr:four-carbon acid sugar kinase family protein [Anaerocolumna sedimenticola]QHQ59658.1 hydroxyacid dehydrogenase [Anaerocolumna sedimenticola]
MNEKNLTINVLSEYREYDVKLVNETYLKEIKQLNKKIIVLDDDPTGVQTVHDIYVYTNWDKDSIRSGFLDENKMFFILTNSRGLTEEETGKLHKEIAENVCAVSKELNQEFILVSRGDSTLRGHYPLETKVLKETLEENSQIKVDGEIICPFFQEGGRYTLNDVHYVAEGEMLVPAGNTEFAKDRTFGYASSNLAEWVEEKSKGEFRREDVISISLEELRTLDYNTTVSKLNQTKGFQKVVVNAISYEDIKVFVVSLIRSMNQGKNFMFRTAAALTKVLGGVSDKEVLTSEELKNTENRNGGIIIVGSHVNKTTRQLEQLKSNKKIKFIEFNVHLVVDDNKFRDEQQRVIKEAEESIAEGTTVTVYTRRERFDLNTGNREDDLKLSVKISDAVTSIITSLTIRPNFIIAKGGITSSDVGTKGLSVKKALVLGQILPGIPVWLTGGESKFPDMPYVIFPGNVGSDTALFDAVNKLM